MYIRKIVSKNLGPIKKIQLLLPLENGVPKPVVLVGENGTGKSTLISNVVDSFYEIAGAAYPDARKHGETEGYEFYKIINPIEIHTGEKYLYSYIKYESLSGEIPSIDYDSYDKLFRLKYGKTINYAGGVKNMTHRIFYGTDFKLTDSDKKMFSREGYECKDLLQGRAGLPVVVSQKQDKDFPIWKVQYGFSCLVFPTYEDAMDFCRDRFTRLDGKAV